VQTNTSNKSKEAIIYKVCYKLPRTYNLFATFHSLFMAISCPASWSECSAATLKIIALQHSSIKSRSAKVTQLDQSANWYNRKLISCNICILSSEKFKQKLVCKMINNWRKM